MSDQLLDPRGYAPATVAGRYVLLAQVMRAAVRRRLIPETPCYDIELPPVEAGERQHLRSPLELTRFAGYFPELYRPLVLALSGVGRSSPTSSCWEV